MQESAPTPTPNEITRRDFLRLKSRQGAGKGQIAPEANKGHVELNPQESPDSELNKPVAKVKEGDVSSVRSHQVIYGAAREQMLKAQARDFERVQYNEKTAQLITEAAHAATNQERAQALLQLSPEVREAVLGLWATTPPVVENPQLNIKTNIETPPAPSQSVEEETEEENKAETQENSTAKVSSVEQYRMVVDTTKKELSEAPQARRVDAILEEWKKKNPLWKRTMVALAVIAAGAAVSSIALPVLVPGILATLPVGAPAWVLGLMTGSVGGAVSGAVRGAVHAQRAEKLLQTQNAESGRADTLIGKTEYIGKRALSGAFFGSLFGGILEGTGAGQSMRDTLGSWFKGAFGGGSVPVAPAEVPVAPALPDACPSDTYLESIEKSLRDITERLEGLEKAPRGDIYNLLTTPASPVEAVPVVPEVPAPIESVIQDPETPPANQKPVVPSISGNIPKDADLGLEPMTLENAPEARVPVQPEAVVPPPVAPPAQPAFEGYTVAKGGQSIDDVIGSGAEGDDIATLWEGLVQRARSVLSDTFPGLPSSVQRSIVDLYDDALNASEGGVHLFDSWQEVLSEAGFGGADGFEPVDANKLQIGEVINPDVIFGNPALAEHIARRLAENPELFGANTENVKDMLAQMLARTNPDISLVQAQTLFGLR